jgi:hypothetical protein
MEREPLDTGRIYTATQLVVMTTAPNEVVSLLASSLARVEILGLKLGESSTGTAWAANVELFRGTSASTGGSTGAAVPSVNRSGWLTAPAATSVVSAASTTLNSTANTSRLDADTIAIDSGKYEFKPSFPPILDIFQRFHARITPLTTAALTGVAVTLTYKEVGRTPQ